MLNSKIKTELRINYMMRLFLYWAQPNSCMIGFFLSDKIMAKSILNKNGL